MADVELKVIEGGGVTSAQGFKAAGVHAGFRRNPNRFDFALVVADEPCAVAGVFTQNVFCAAPVILCRERLGGQGFGVARAIAINSGIANAATGQIGLENARTSAAVVAEVLGCPEQEVLVSSTGVIGQHLNMEPFRCGAQMAYEALSREGGTDAAKAIMTTDTKPKYAAVQFSGDGIGFDGCTFTVGGMAKGSGMIMPNMATMISVITTDAPIANNMLHAALKAATAESFNRVTVDGDTSTNDTCFLLASGQAAKGAGAYFEEGSAAMEAFQCALNSVCQTLARAMAADGEGATKLVTVNINGAACAEDADAAARTVANSPLVKTAIFGHDANWGRIAAALGRSGAQFDQMAVDIDILGLAVCRGGLTVAFDEEEALRRFQAPEVVIDVNLGAGSSSATMWTCDFSHDYVSINGDYRS